MTASPLTTRPTSSSPATDLRLAVLVASPNGGRSGRHVATWVLDRLGRHDGLAVDVLDVRSVAPARLADAIEAADAVIVVVPEYNHSFPGVLKTAIDALGEEWVTTVVGVVSYGGISGGLRATEQLRLVFAELHALVVRDTVSFHDVADRFDPDGRLRDAPAVEAAFDRMLASLRWWTGAIRAGHDLARYPR